MREMAKELRFDTGLCTTIGGIPNEEQASIVSSIMICSSIETTTDLVIKATSLGYNEGLANGYEEGCRVAMEAVARKEEWND